MSQNEMLRFGKIYIEKCKFHIIKELTGINKKKSILSYS